jgi:hypothetical protein
VGGGLKSMRGGGSEIFFGEGSEEYFKEISGGSELCSGGPLGWWLFAERLRGS